MKLTKKILSLVLAAALVLGSIAVAANAADYDGLTYEGSKLTYKITADKTEVKPGETVKFSVYMTTNFYTGASGGEFFLWDAGVFEALGSNFALKNFRTKFTTTNTNPANVNSYPTAYSKTAYVGFQSSHALAANVTVPQILDNELVYEFTFTVSESAAPGTTARFFMPAEAVKSPSLSGKKGMIFQCIGTSADDVTSVGNWCETVDLSQASVTITVASAVEYCDYAALEAAVAKAPALDKAYYDANEYAAWEAAVAAGNELLDAEPLVDEGDNQKTIDDAAALVESTLAALDARYVDLESLANAVEDNKTPAYAEEYYDAAAYEAWEKAYAAAEAALTTYANAPATKQGEVNEINNDLIDAWNALVPVFVNLDKLNAAVEAYDELAYGKDYYDADLYAAWEAALADAKAAQTTYANAPVTKQAEVDAIADDLQAAFVALNPSILDLTALNNAIEASDEAEYAAEYYDEAEYAAWEKALADAKAGVVTYTGAADTAANQAAVAALAKALTDAFAALDARFVDASAIDAAITAYGATEYAAEYYDAAEYKAYTDALAAAKDADFAGKADTAANQAAVAAIVADLKAAYEALDARFVDASAIEDAINAYGATEYAAEYYDADEYAAYTAALAAAKDADFAGKADTEANRAAVAAIVADLKAAYEALDARFVDTSALEEAIAKKPAYGAEYYDAAAYNAWQAEVAFAESLFNNELKGAADTEMNRKVVAQATLQLNEAYAALVPQFVSYAKLEAAIAEFGATPEVEFYYTPESYATWLDAFVAAEEANNNRPEPLPAANEKNQAAIDALADALEKAYNELEAAVCHVISVTPLQENYVVNDIINFAVLVEGEATKVQIIKESGVTTTYERTHTSVVKITDNGDGTETWVIARRVYEDNVNEYAKSKFGRVWDTGVTPFAIKCSTTGADYAVKSVEVTVNGEAVTAAYSKDIVTTTIVTGPAATKVRFIDPVTGNTMTISTPTAINDDGTKVWIHTKQYGINEYYYDIQSKGNDGVWHESDFNVELTITKKPVPQVPSTGEVKDAVLNATIAKNRIVRDKTQQIFTIETDIAAKAVRIIAKDGTVIKVTEATSVTEDMATWTIEKTYSIIGDYSYTVEALYGSTWIANEAITLDFTVVY